MPYSTTYTLYTSFTGLHLQNVGQPMYKTMHYTCSLHVHILLILQLQPCMVVVTNLLSKYTIFYGMTITLVVTIQSVARRWTASMKYSGTSNEYQRHNLYIIITDSISSPQMMTFLYFQCVLNLREEDTSLLRTVPRCPLHRGWFHCISKRVFPCFTCQHSNQTLQTQLKLGEEKHTLP